MKAAKWGKTACSWFGSALRADFPPSGADSGAGAMGVLPSAPETDIHVGFSPESTPTLGLHPSRVRRRLCHLGSKIKINGNNEPIPLTDRHYPYKTPFMWPSSKHRQPPVNRRQAVLFEKLVGPPEMAVADKAFVSRQR
ncbi:beta-galactosidase [Pseudomonas sp. StFLB209]|nr:beta-galactosidase [Pseudomonas sp. StFLB209]